MKNLKHGFNISFKAFAALMLLLSVGSVSSVASAHRVRGYRSMITRRIHQAKRTRIDANQVNPFGIRAYPVRLPKQLRGYWIKYGSTDMYVTGYHVGPGHWKYWKPVKRYMVKGRPISAIVSYDFTRKGSAFYKSHGRYLLRRGYRPYAITLFHLKRHNRLQVGVQILSRRHRGFRKFIGTYYKVSSRRYHNIANGLDSLTIHHTND